MNILNKNETVWQRVCTIILGPISQNEVIVLRFVEYIGIVGCIS